MNKLIKEIAWNHDEIYNWGFCESLWQTCKAGFRLLKTLFTLLFQIWYYSIQAAMLFITVLIVLFAIKHILIYIF